MQTYLNTQSNLDTEFICVDLALGPVPLEIFQRNAPCSSSSDAEDDSISVSDLGEQMTMAATANDISKLFWRIYAVVFTSLDISANELCVARASLPTDRYKSFANFFENAKPRLLPLQNILCSGLAGVSRSSIEQLRVGSVTRVFFEKIERLASEDSEFNFKLTMLLHPTMIRTNQDSDGYSSYEEMDF